MNVRCVVGEQLTLERSDDGLNYLDGSTFLRNSAKRNQLPSSGVSLKK
jgi:hypothetical protein